MTNALKNTALVTKYAVVAFENALNMAVKVDRQLDTTRVYSSKVGATVQIRRPVMFEANQTEQINVGDIQDIEEATVTVNCDGYQQVPFAITSVEKTLNIEQINERYIEPAMLELAQKVESDIAAQYKYIPNIAGTPGTGPSTFLHVAALRAKLMSLGVPYNPNWCAFFGPDEMMNLSDGLKAVFPTEISKRAIENAGIGRYGGFNIYENQSLALHTVGVNTGTGAVNGANQNVTYAASKDTDTQSLITDGWTASQTGILKAGDAFNLDNVYSVNRRTRQSTGYLQDFTVTADADSDAGGNATFTISPAIITSGPYQTVTAAPANNAAITVLTGTGGTSYRQNLAWHKNAITLAFAQLDTPDDGATSYRQNFKNVSIRMVKQHDISLGKTIYKLDCLYAVKVQNPGFAIRRTS